MAMGDTLRGIFPARQTFPNWDEFVKDLKPKFMPHTADLALFVDSEQWNMRGDWPGFHSVVQAFKLCHEPSLHPALMVNMIKALDSYLRRKVVKEPRPTSLDEEVVPPQWVGISRLSFPGEGPARGRMEIYPSAGQVPPKPLWDTRRLF